MKILYLVTIPLSAKSFLSKQLAYMVECGHEVHIATSYSDTISLEDFARSEGVFFHYIPFKREISLLSDINSLIRAMVLISTIKPDVVNSGTPKAGLIGTLASRILGIRKVIYTLHGLRLQTTTGAKRRLLYLMERIACSSADVIVCVSKSLMTEAINLDLAPERKFIVINNGTANGVNTTLFRNPADDPSTLKSTLGIPAEKKVIGFAGRITRDKGIEDLYRAFRLLTGDYILLIIGSIESNDPIDPVILQEIRSRQDIIMPGFVDNIADYYHIMDVLVLPSYREGFGMVALEAAAAGVPAIVSDSTGVRDAVIHQHTGLVFKTGDFIQLYRSMEEILSNDAKRKRLGEQAQRRVETEFIPQEIWIQLNRIYHK